LTPLFVAILTRELREHLIQGRLSHISQSSNETVEFSIYHPERPNHYLTIALIPTKPLLFIGSEKRGALPKPPNLCRSLRKHLEYAQITGIHSVPGERIIQFNLKTAEGNFRLIFEGIPKYPNLILVGPDGFIISASRYKNEVERPVLPQAVYSLPPQPIDRPNHWDLDQAPLRELWEKAGKPALGPWLKDHFRGTDPELSSYMESRGEGIFTEWPLIKAKILGPGWTGFHLFPGPPPSLKVFPSVKDLEKTHQTYPNIHPALERLFELELDFRQWSFERHKLESEIAKAVKHEKRILEKLKKDRGEAERSDQYQWWGELVMAQLHQIPHHLRQIDLEDVVRGTGQTIAIPLDPEISPLLNAQRFFKKAQKGSRGLVLVEKREKEIKERLEALKAAQRSLPAIQHIREIKKAFQDLFPRKPEAELKPKKPKEDKVATPNILREKVDKLFELCAGTSAAANEYVTFQLAQPEDLWFHVRDLPGSHVILRRLHRDIQPPEELVLRAAKLAATHSKAQPGTKVTVSYTQKKNIKRIPGAPMGMVSMTKEKSLVVEI